MVKADKKAIFNGNQPEDFSEFEYLVARVDQLEKVINSHADILRNNNITLSKEHHAPYFNDDEVFRALAGG